MAGINFVSPVGRIVSGSVHSPSTTDMEGKPLVYKSGANAGQPRNEYFFAIAVPKDSPELGTFWQLLQGVAKQSFPQFFQNPNGQCSHPGFSWKMKDGDGVDANGKSNAEKEGWKGCYVFSFKGSFAPQAWKNGQPMDPKQIPAGHYIRVLGSVEGNGGGAGNGPAKPGLYLNHNAVEHIGYGPEIVGGPDARAAFGQQPAAWRPPGMTDAPVGGTPVTAGTPAPAMPAMPGAPAMPPVAAPPVAGAPPAYPGAMAGAPPAYPGAAAPSVPAAPAAPMAPPVAAPPPAPVQRQMTAKANGVPYESWIQQKWTDDMLIQHGLMLPVAAVAAAFAYPGAR